MGQCLPVAALWGKVIAFVSRFLGALLLGLAILAVRDRVKR